jgi:hypothetical protein
MSDTAVATELLLGGWSDAVVDAIAVLPAILGEDEYGQLQARGAAMSDDEVIAYVSTELERLERERA